MSKFNLKFFKHAAIYLVINMKTLTLRASLVVVALMTFSTAALAQYVWLDDKGSKQFSDQPPPSTVPKNKILKVPGGNIDRAISEPDADTDQTKKTKQPESVAEKEAAYKKRRDEMAAKDKKATEEAKNTAAKADNCKRMREYKQSLDSGQRISQTDANGNRSYLTDEKRAQEQSTVTQSLGDCAN